MFGSSGAFGWQPASFTGGPDFDPFGMEQEAFFSPALEDTKNILKMILSRRAAV